MPAVWYRFRAELRTRWRAWLGLAVLIGAAAGGITLAAAGARRTSTAYDRFLASQRAFDVIAGCPLPEEAPECDTDAAARLAGVEDAAHFTSWGPERVEVRTAGGRGVQPEPDNFDYTGPGEITIVASPDNRFGSELNRLKILSGRAPDPEHADEVAVPVDVARRADLEVGDALEVTFLGPPETEDAPPTRLPPVTLRIVAIEVAPFEVAPTSGMYASFLHATPAFLEAVPDGALSPSTPIALRVRSDVSMQRFVDDLDRRGFQIVRQADQAQLVEDAIRPQAVALWLVAALGGLAGFAVLGQLLARQTFLESTEYPTLRSLGFGRTQLWGLAMTRAAAIGAGGGVIATVVAAALSPLTPIGRARTVEPDPGLSFDLIALALGIVVTTMGALAVVALPGWRAALAADPDRATGTLGARPTLAAGAAAAIGMPPAPLAGVRMALEPGRGRSAVPVRVGLVGVTAGIVAMAAALSFTASLDHLFATPRLSGWNWDVEVAYPYVPGPNGEFGPEDQEVLSRALADDEGIEAFGFGHYFRPFPTQDYSFALGERSRVDVIAFGDGPIGPTVIDGRAPAGPDEILVGTDVLDELDLDVGDRVEAEALVGESDKPSTIHDVSATFRIVGTGAVPTPGGELGRGAAITLAGLQALDPEQDFSPRAIWLRLAPGADLLDVLTRVGSSLGLLEPGAQPDPAELGAIGWDRSRELLDVKQVDDLPTLLSGLMALLAAGTLAHVLVSAVRARRREFAVLKTLGFVRGQVRGAVASQATITALLALAIGFPLGIAAGRWVWQRFAEQLGVLPEPTVPLLALIFAAAAIVVVANLVAAVPAWFAARTKPAVMLRTE